MAVSVAVRDIFSILYRLRDTPRGGLWITCQNQSVNKWRDLENQVRGRSRSLKMAPFDRPYATFYWSVFVNALSCTFSSYLTLNNIVTLKSGL